MATPSLHPSIGPGIGSSLGSPGQLHSPISTLSSPINGMGPPFSVISSPMGPHSMSVPSTPSLGFGTSSPQVRGRGWGRGRGSFIGARTQPGRGGGDDPGPVVLPKRARGAKPPRRHPWRGGQAPKGGEKQKPKGEMKLGLLRQGGGTAGAQGWIASIHPSAAISCPPLLLDGSETGAGTAPGSPGDGLSSGREAGAPSALPCPLSRTPHVPSWSPVPEARTGGLPCLLPLLPLTEGGTGVGWLKIM